MKIRRRDFLATASTAVMVSSASKSSANSDDAPIQLTAEHQAAVNRRRRIVVQFDAHSNPGGILGIDIDQWVDYRFDYIDEPGTQIDSIWWDVTSMGYAIYPSKVLEPASHPGLQKWQDQGIDWIQRLSDETRKRKLENFLSHRISGVELKKKGGADWNGTPHPIKQAHPDWVIKTWWKQGLWNLAVAGVRQLKLDILRELAENYDFDGFQIDFARHIPCLPPPRQWELRSHVTEFMRSLRLTLLEVAAGRGKPILLAARIPRNLAGCHVDGFDIQEWSRQNLVDILTLGTRSIDVDIASFRRVTSGHNIKLQPCFDDHHATDAYQYPSIEFFRGVASNWWQQGADSLMTFNWSNANPEWGRKMGALHAPDSERKAYHEIGSPATLLNKDKIFAVDRRGAFPWAEGYFNRNDDAQLPVEIPADGTFVEIVVRIGDPLSASAERVKSTRLQLVLHGASADDEIEAVMNGTSLSQVVRDEGWKDYQIFYPQPQPSSGGADHWKVDPHQKLLRVEYSVDPQYCQLGNNQVTLRRKATDSRLTTNPLRLEKLELHVEYHAEQD